MILSMSSLPTLPEGLPPWLASGASIIFLCLLLWKRLAEVKGPIGALARWWNTRQVRAIENEMTIETKVQEWVALRVKSETKGFHDAIERLESQVKELQEARQEDQLRLDREEARRQAAEESRDMWSGYATLLTSVLHRVRQKLAEHGLGMEDVPSFTEYRRSRDPTN